MLRSTFLKMLGAQNVTHTLQPNEANAKSSSVDVSLRAIHAGFQSFLPGKRFSKDKSCLNKRPKNTNEVRKLRLKFAK
jgi:hypothetical protein